MTKEDYVSFETAKLLKEKGFDARCPMIYTADGEMLYTDVKHHNMYAVTNKQLEYCTDIIAPTLQMAMKWLREVYKIHIIAEPCLGEGDEPNLSFNRWFWTILKEEGEYEPIRKIEEFSTYEQAIEAAIKYCLDNLI